ncbi:MAG: DUF2177 family protein [Planctomycetaceae bacterium]|nr:DUF2177 family protein [Planctomycetaceae bacterium]
MFSIKLYLAVLLVFLACDAVWIGLLMKDFYNTELGELARRDGPSLAPRWPAAILVYLLIPLGIVVFVRPAMGPSATLLQALGWGLLFGLIGYGIYDLTNRATLENWSLRLTIVDILWGALLCGSAAVTMRAVERWLQR